MTDLILFVVLMRRLGYELEQLLWVIWVAVVVWKDRILTRVTDV